MRPPRGDRQGGADGRPVWSDVEAAVSAAKERTNPKGQASLGHVFDAVVALRRAGSRISIEAVGDWCVQKHSGPIAQSIRNNERLVDLVRIAMAVQAADALPTGDRPVEQGVLEQVGNPELRAELERLLAHRRMLIVENANLRLALRRVKAISFVSKEMMEADLETLEALADRIKDAKGEGGGPTFAAEEVKACEVLLARGLAAVCLSVDEASGEIVDRHGRTIAERGVADALRKVAGSKLLD